MEFSPLKTAFSLLNWTMKICRKLPSSMQLLIATRGNHNKTFDILSVSLKTWEMHDKKVLRLFLHKMHMLNECFIFFF